VRKEEFTLQARGTGKIVANLLNHSSTVKSKVLRIKRCQNDITWTI